MYPNWLLPEFDADAIKKIPHEVRKHQIKGDWEMEESIRLKKSDTRKRHEEWQKLAESGMKRFAIAKMYGVDSGTVSHALGPIFNGRRQGRDRKPMLVDGKRYETQREVFTAFRVRISGLRKLIEEGRARYV